MFSKCRQTPTSPSNSSPTRARCRPDSRCAPCCRRHRKPTSTPISLQRERARSQSRLAQALAGRTCAHDDPNHAERQLAQCPASTYRCSPKCARAASRCASSKRRNSKWRCLRIGRSQARARIVRGLPQGFQRAKGRTAGDDRSVVGRRRRKRSARSVLVISPIIPMPRKRWSTIATVPGSRRSKRCSITRAARFWSRSARCILPAMSVCRRSCAPTVTRSTVPRAQSGEAYFAPPANCATMGKSRA